MMKRITKTALAALLGLAVAPVSAVAQEVEIELHELEEREEPITTRNLVTQMGVGALIGGGVKNYVEPEARDFLTPGGFWTARAILGTRTPIGFEAAYIGSANDLEAVGLNEDAFLVSNGGEGALRLNAPITAEIMSPDGAMQIPMVISPYAFGGLGYTRYTLVNEDEPVAAIASNDDVLHVPLGVGLGIGLGNLNLDARLAYRQAFFSDLLGDTTSSFDDASLNSWSLTGGLGFEF